MRVTFLGSSHGVPEPNRQCACTMIQVGDRVYMIDMGKMVINDLVTRGIPVDAVKGVFITHMHGDHTDGLIHFVDLINWYFRTADPLIHLPKIEAVEALAGWLRVNGEILRGIRFAQIEPGVVYDDGVLKVTAYATQHIDKSYAYLVEAEDRTILFTGDLKRPGVDFPEVIRERKIDLVVCEAAHFSATEYEPVLKSGDVARVCVNHHAPWNIPNIQKLAEAMGDIPVTTVYDGLEVNF